MNGTLAGWSRGRWLAILFALLLLSLGALGVRVAGYPEWIPALLKPLADAFLEPGASLWWFTAGGVFQAFPGSTTGRVNVVLGNTLLWFLAVLTVRALWRALRR